MPHRAPKRKHRWIEPLEKRQLLSAIPPFQTVETFPYDGLFPPDPHVAASSNYTIAVINTQLQAYDRNGNLVLSQSLANFFNASDGFFDPKVQYDAQDDRFVVVAFAKTDPDSTNVGDTAHIWVAVSQSGDPRRDSKGRGNWNVFSTAADLTIGGNHSWMDYPGVAVDSKAIYITANAFGFNGGGFNGSRLWILDTQKAYSGLNPFVSVQDPCGSLGINEGFTMQPAQAYGPIGGSIGTWLVFWNNSNLFGDDFLNVLRVDNPLTAPSFATTSIDLGNVAGSFAGSPPSTAPDSPQPGTSTGITSDDSRFLDVKWRNNELWGVATIEGNGQSRAFWFRVSTTVPSTPTLLNTGSINGAAISANGGVNHPSIAIDPAMNVSIGFAVSSPTLYSSAAYVTAPISDLSQLNGPATVYAPGLATYILKGSDGRNRWGDYTGMAVDPNGVFWAFNEYASTPDSGGNSRWATRLAAFSATTVVTNTHDFGPGSLRFAINSANGMPGAQTIRFHIPTSDPNYASGNWTIHPLSPLPPLIDGTSIDGLRSTPDPFGVTHPVIILNGALAGPGAGLRLMSFGSTVDNLTIQNFNGNGVQIDGGALNTVTGCDIGTSADGKSAAGNTANGVYIGPGSSGNTIGLPASIGNTVGSPPFLPNVISGNLANGVLIQTATVNTVSGNFIGTTWGATAAIPNDAGGVLITGTSVGNIIGANARLTTGGNFISGNKTFGVRIDNNSSDNTVAGNTIGLGQFDAALGNGGDGVVISLEAHGNFIGNPDLGGNVISGNAGDGILIGTATQNTVQNNYIGVDQSFDLRPNALDGISLTNGARDNLIGGNRGGLGGAGPGATGNIISGNGHYGVELTGAPGNTIQGNFIGVLPTLPASPAGNLLGGINLVAATATVIGGPGVQGNYIGANGGTAPSGNGINIGNSATSGSDGTTIQGNFIGSVGGAQALVPGNAGDGILVNSFNILIGTVAPNQIGRNGQIGVAVIGTSSAPATGVTIRMNRIDQNGGLGIDLGGDGVTPNHVPAVTTGPNNDQNYPVLSLAQTIGSTTRVAGSLTALPTVTYIIDAYESPAADPSGFGEGATWLGTFNVTTNAAGNAPFDVTLPATSIPGHFVTLTATWQNGSTSEFSGAVKLVDKTLPQVHLGLVQLSGTVLAPFQTISFEFNKNVGASIATSDLNLVDITTGTAVDTSSATTSFDAATNTAIFDLSSLGVLPQGIYQATLPAGSIQDSSGNTMPSDFVFRFALMPGTSSDDQFNITGGDGLIRIDLLSPGLPAPRTLSAALGGVDQIVVAGMDGNDTFTIGSIPPSSNAPLLSIFGGPGNDTLNSPWGASAGGPALPLPLAFDGGPGTDQLKLTTDDTPQNVNITNGMIASASSPPAALPVFFTNTQITLFAGGGNDTFTFDGPDTLFTLNTGGGNNSVTIRNLPATGRVNVMGGNGNDALMTDSTDLGTISMVGGTASSGGGADTVTFDGSDLPQTIAMADGSVRPPQGQILYSQIQSLVVNTGNGNNAINIASSSAGVSTAINGGSGNDTFTVMGGDLLGPVWIDGGTTPAGATDHNTLIFDDHAATTVQTYVLGTGTITRGNLPPLTYQNIDSFMLDVSSGGSVCLNPQPLPPRTSNTIGGSAADDKLIMSVPDPITFNGGAGNDTLDLEGASFDISSDLSAGTANLTLAVGGDVVVRTEQHLAAVNVKNGGRLSLAPGTNTSLYTSALTIAPTGSLDIHDGMIVVRPSAANLSAALSAIGGYVRAAMGAPAAGGSVGLSSSLTRLSALRGVAAVLNDKGNGTALLSTLAGHPVLFGDILVTVSWKGDTNLDGLINFDDYFQTNTGFLSNGALGGYRWGDFNYDSLINFDDYFLLNTSFLGQGPLMQDQTADSAVSVAAPLATSVAPKLARGVFDGRSSGQAHSLRRKTPPTRKHRRRELINPDSRGHA